MFDLEIGGATATESEPITGTVEAVPALIVTVEPAKVQTVFTEAHALDPLIARIAQAVKDHTPDTTTAKGRKEIASLAFRVAKTKTYLDDLGKALVAGLKELPKKIDANRLDMRTRLDALRDEARKPLDEWEAEQARIEAEKKAALEAEALAKEIEFTHEIALLMNADWDRKREEDRAAAEAAAKLREDQIRQEAAEAERRASAQREIDARLAQERAEREAAEAEQRAKDAEARAELERKAAAEREEQARIEATQAAERRQREAEEQQRRETEKREADVEHRRAINREAMADLMAAGIPEEMAKLAVTAILQGKVRNVGIRY